MVLPAYGKKKVHFRSDGANCFNSKEAKSGMVFFGDQSKVNPDVAYELSYKISVAGCGKTALDVSFIFILFIIQTCNSNLMLFATPQPLLLQLTLY